MNCKKTVLFTVFTGLLSGAALAQSGASNDAEFDKLDTNGDGSISVAEAKGTWIESAFKQLDANQDGLVSRSEYNPQK